MLGKTAVSNAMQHEGRATPCIMRESLTAGCTTGRPWQGSMLQQTAEQAVVCTEGD